MLLAVHQHSSQIPLLKVSRGDWNEAEEWEQLF
jgi:hypothetical protein